MAGPEKWSVGASMYLGPAYTVAGSLSLSSSEVRFFGSEDRVIRLCEITEVRVGRQRWWHPRKTVQVVTQTGDPTWFLVNRQAQVARRIQGAVETANGEAPQS